MLHKLTVEITDDELAGEQSTIELGEHDPIPLVGDRVVLIYRHGPTTGVVDERQFAYQDNICIVTLYCSRWPVD